MRLPQYRISHALPHASVLALNMFYEILHNVDQFFLQADGAVLCLHDKHLKQEHSAFLWTVHIMSVSLLTQMKERAFLLCSVC